MTGLVSCGSPAYETRILAGRAMNEDACVLSVPEGSAIVQTVDILTPIVNDPERFGRIAAANALSDVYAMGGRPWCAMNIACVPSAWTEGEGTALVQALLRGGMSALDEAGAVLAGGHTVQDEELKYGLSVTGVIDPAHIAANDRLLPGLQLVLTKSLGTGILATAVKACWDGADECEETVFRSCARLNKYAGEAIRSFGLPAATDVTGFGLIGHALEMATASRVRIVLEAGRLPFLPRVLDLAGDGLIPQGCYRNHSYCLPRLQVDPGVDELVALCACDPQTSGGLLLAVPQEKVPDVCAYLHEQGDEAHCIGHVLPETDECARILVLP